VEDVRGAARRLPLSGPLFLAGFLAITGTPPFSPFFSEFMIVNGAFAGGRWGVGTLFLVFLAIIFVGMGTTVLKIVQGEPSGTPAPQSGDTWLTAGPPLALLLIVLLLGLFLPREVSALFQSAASLVVGS
jgi:hydrogenase-4 component F